MPDSSSDTCRLATVMPSALTPLVDYLLHTKADIDAVLEAGGLRREMLRDLDHRITQEADSHIWEAAERLSGDQLIGMRVALFTPPGEDAFYFAFGASENLRQAFLRFGAYYVTLRTAARGIVHVSDDDSGEVTLRLSVDPPTSVHRQAILYVLTSWITIARRATGQMLVPRCARLPIRSVDQSGHLAMHFGSQLEFDAPVGELIFSDAEFREPLQSANPSLCDLLEHYVTLLARQIPQPEPSIVLRVRDTLLRTIGSPEVSASFIAGRLGMSERSLQRHLQAVGASFLAVRDDVFCQVAKHYLKRPRLSVAEIACLLGYSEESAFHRAFKRWTGQTPAEFRRR